MALIWRPWKHPINFLLMHFRVIKLTSDLNQLHIVINLLLITFIKEIVCTLPPNISTIFLFKITHLLDSCSLHYDLDVLCCCVMLMFMVCGVTIMSTCVIATSYLHQTIWNADGNVESIYKCFARAFYYETWYYSIRLVTFLDAH